MKGINVCPYCNSDLEVDVSSGELICEGCKERYHSPELVTLHHARVERDELYKVASKVNSEMVETGHLNRRTVVKLGRVLEKIDGRG